MYSAVSFPGTQRCFGNLSLFAGIPKIFPVILEESVENGSFVPTKGKCCREHDAK